MSLFVKICGLKTADTVRAAASAGADAIGLNFHPPSPRCITPRHAARLAAAAPRKLLLVAVMLRPEQSDWDKVYAGFKPDCVQAEAVSLARLSLPPGMLTMPVYRDHEEFDPNDVPAGMRCLFEGSRSGAGEQPSWERAARLARRAEVLLAGGLDPGNVGEAVRRVRPWGVDVSSGVESARGVKDDLAVREFVRAARRTDARP